MGHSDEPEFAVIGAGLAGPLAALFLAQAGRSVALYERRPDPRVAGLAQGKSINLALSLRGIAALRQVGLADEALAASIPMRGRRMHARDGQLSFHRYGKDDSEVIRSISRGGLNLALVRAAERHANVQMHFDQRCTAVDLESGRFELRDERTGAVRTAAARHVIAADGAFSVARREMQRLERFDYSQHFLEYGYKELAIPPAPGGGFRLEQHCLHIWPRRSYMMIALPNVDGSFTCTLFAPYAGADGFDALHTAADVQRYFDQRFPDATAHMPGLADDFLSHPTGALVTVRCGPWHVADRVALLGDAAHAVVPFYGQGMNASFEDCSVLAESLARHRSDVSTAFAEYYARRKPNTDALSRLAVENFVEMRDKVGSRAFLRRKRFEGLLHRALPRTFVPLYTLVTFTQTPYAEAERRAALQERFLKRTACSALAVALFLLVLWLSIGGRGGCR